MNYIKEMNAFFDWLETNPLEASTQTLWFHLMAVANKSGWPEWFAVANPLLQAKVGISENSLTKHRNTLVQKGRIEYRSQGKKQAGKYRLIPFTSNFEVMEGVKCEVIRGVNHEVKGSALFKLKETKENETIKSSAAHAIETNERENFYCAYQRTHKRELTPFQVQKLSAYIDNDGMEESVIINAMERAALKGGGLSLIITILNDYAAGGVKTLGAARSFDYDFDKRKKGLPGVLTQRKPKLAIVDGSKSNKEITRDAYRKMLDMVCDLDKLPRLTDVEFEKKWLERQAFQRRKE